jgi:chaperonin GroEL
MILLYNKVITHHKQIEKMIALVLAARRPLVIVCAGAQEEGLAYLAVNNQPRVDKNGQYVEAPLKCCVVKAPPSMDNQDMEDLAILTGATFMADNRGTDIKEMKLTDFGTCRRVVINKDETIFIEGRSKQDQLDNLLTELRIQKRDAKNEDEAAPIEKRIAKLTGGVAVIQVGAATETEMKEKMDRFDDSVRAVKSAIAEGYVPGAGTTFLRIRSGNKIVDSAMDMILKQICYNVGAPPREWWQFWRRKGIFERVRDATGNIGYNAKSGKIEDLIEAGVIDPAKVIRCAIQNAASSATMFLTCECLIVDTF